MTADNVVHIEFYGVLTEKAGRTTMELPVDAGTALGDVLRQLADELPGISASLPTTACAVDDEIVQRSAVINPGSRLALLPPVSGG